MLGRVRHSEQRPGEVYMVDVNPINFFDIGWSSKRLGRVDPQTVSKKFMSKMCPLFVEYVEILSNGMVSSHDAMIVVRDDEKAQRILPFWKNVFENVKASRAQRSASGFKQWSQTLTMK